MLKKSLVSQAPLLRRGGVDATSRKYRKASFMERTGWCWSMVQKIKLLANTTVTASHYRARASRPSARAKVASRLLFTPRILPSSAEEGSFRSTALRDSSSMLMPPLARIGFVSRWRCEPGRRPEFREPHLRSIPAVRQALLQGRPIGMRGLLASPIFDRKPRGASHWPH